MNRKEIIKFYGHPQTQLATQLGVAKQYLTKWVAFKGVTDRTVEIATMCNCSVAEVFYTNPIQELYAGEGIQDLEIALEGLNMFSEKHDVDISEAVAAIWAIAEKNLKEIP